ncbi:PP2C-domain-containing protein [Terfezia boudieri ATCC MYA-4762]|uniref:Adenylate cyclase n=1 Tax=Terfezia boudieri ATCC MYA-4762 TaxID=1051890 RepID=A0A3N4M1P0_9PEZI|nr:PP2C-domain-containing protein [Terfezia boudieri ATCC MYA-4762]
MSLGLTVGFDRDQSVSPGSHIPSSPPMGSPSASASMMGLGDHRRELSVLQTPTYIRNSPSSGPVISPAGTANGFPSATTPVSAASTNNGSHGFLNSNPFDSYQSDHFQNSSQNRPGTAPGPNGSTSSGTIGPDSYFPQDDRRPSVASLATNASSTGSKTSIGRSIVRRFFGEDDKESPGSSDSSLLQNNVLQRPSAAYTRTNTQPGSRPQTPVPSSDVVPFLYQDIHDIPKYGEAPVRQTPVMAGMRYDGTEEPDPKLQSAYRSAFKRKKEKVDKDKELPPPPSYKDFGFSKEHRKELAKIDGMSLSQNSSQSRLGDRPSSPTPSIASSLSNNVPKSPGLHLHKKSFLPGFMRKKGKGEELERSETPQLSSKRNQKPELPQLSNPPYKIDATLKRGSPGGVGSSVTAEYHNYIHPRAFEYAASEHQIHRKNQTGGQQAHVKSKPMKRGYSSNDTSVTRKLGGLVRPKGEEENLYPFDTNLGDLEGIVSSRQDMTPPSGKLLKVDEPLKPGNISVATPTAPESIWRVPDSWRYCKEGDNVETASRGESLDIEFDMVEKPGQEAQRRPSLAYCIRVFRADSTFATLSCNISASVSELLRMLGRKSFLQDDLGNYQLIIKKGEMSRILQPQERPLQIQKRLLEQAGYTQYDHLEEIGREDHSYLCRFNFRMSKIGGCSLEADPGLSKMQKFNHVELQGKNLFTIPILLYQKASEIIALNLSYNLSVDIPTDFIQACINLRKIEFQGNEATKLPPSISYASRLTYLDISNNRIETLEPAELHKASALVSLKMTNNQLTSLPARFAAFKNLRSLHISSNCLTIFPQFICSLANLVDLDISFNAIPTFPDEIGQLSALERLIATNNKLSGSFPPAFANLTSLKELDVRYNPLTNIDVVADLPRVELVLVGHNSVSGLEKSFHKIRALHLNSNPVTRFSLPWAMPTLTSLNLSSAKLTSFGDAVFEKLPNLQKLVLDKNHMASLPAGIGKLKKLEHLSACSNSLKALPADIGQLSELKFLDLHDNNIKVLPAEIWHLPCLATLNMSSNILTTFPKPSVNPNVPPPGSDIGTLPKISDSEDGGKFTDPNESRRPSQTSGGLLSVGSSPGGNGREGSIVSIYGPGGRKASVMSSKSATSTDTGYDRPSGAVTPLPASIRKDSAASNKFANTMAQSLKHLYLADNQLTDDVFEEIQLLGELRILNLSYNGLYDVPNRALGRMVHLNELYLSGNELTSLPADDLEYLSYLKVLHINGNKFQTLPAELGKVRRLLVLDVGTNWLKYNISNWPYDWNWNWNLELKFLNLSGNRRLEIKPNLPQNSSRERSITDFSQLSNLRVLGLMDVTLTIPQVPDQTEDRRVRTSSSMVRNMSYGMADSLGKSEHLSVIDMVVPDFRGNRDECVFGLFDGQSLPSSGSKVAMYLNEHFTYYFGTELSKLRENETTATALRRTFLSLNKGLANTAMQTIDEKTGQTRSIPPNATMLGPDDLQTGSSATVVYLVGNDMFVANVGDAMAILVRSGGDSRVLSRKHEPGFGTELERIREAGGWVSRNGKLNEVLDVSRSFGYFHLIPAVQAAPHIHEVQLSDQDELLILASREVWEYINYQTAVDIVWLYKGDLMRAAHRLRDFAIAYGATNKIMVMLIGVGDLKRAKKKVVHNLQPEEFVIKGGPRRGGGIDDVGLNRLTPEIPAPEGDVSLVFTDIKNSTLLWETHPVAMRAGISIHNQIMRRWLRMIGGYEVKTEGDAFMVAFPTVTSALHWCFTVQNTLLEAPWPNEILDSEHGKEIRDAEGRLIYRGLSVRMGIHFGQPVCEADPITRRMDYFGPMVNRAARIEGEADGGQICVSADFVSEIKRILAGFLQNPGDPSGLFDDPVMAATALDHIAALSTLGFEIKELGERKLKGLENPEFVYLIYPSVLSGRLTAKKPLAPKLVAGDQLWRLWDIALRLEMVCSVLTATGRPEPRVLSSEMAVLLRTAGEGLSEAAIMPMFEHIVSRIEVRNQSLTWRRLGLMCLLQNSMANLAIRKLLSKDGNPFKPGLSVYKMLETLESCITPMEEVV